MDDLTTYAFAGWAMTVMLYGLMIWQGNGLVKLLRMDIKFLLGMVSRVLHDRTVVITKADVDAYNAIVQYIQKTDKN